MLSVESELDSLIQSSSSQQQAASFLASCFFCKAKFISPSKNASEIHFAIKQRRQNASCPKFLIIEGKIHFAVKFPAPRIK